MLKLPAISNDIRALLASKADLNVEMPKLVAKYKVESVEEAGDKLGVLAGEVMTYLINRPRATAEGLQRKFRCTASAAQSIMGVAAKALAAGKARATTTRTSKRSARSWRPTTPSRAWRVSIAALSTEPSLRAAMFRRSTKRRSPSRRSRCTRSALASWAG